MKPAVRYSLFAFTLAAFVAGTVAVCVLNARKHALDTCSEMVVEFADSLRFVREADVRRYVAGGYGVFVGQSADSVKLHKIEAVVRAQSAVKDCQAWICNDGKLHLRISQRQPVARFQNGDKGFYVDEEGFIFPLFPNFTAPVTVVWGEIPFSIPASYKGIAGSGKERGWIESMCSAVEVIGKSRWKGKIDSLQVCPGGDILVRPRGDVVEFNLGEPKDIQDKLHRMDLFYRKIVPFKGQGHYTKVNLKYDNQIICKQQ